LPSLTTPVLSARAQSFTISGQVATVENGDIWLWLAVPFGATLSNLTTYCQSGSCTASLYDGANLRQTQTVTTSVLSQAITGAITQGNNIRINITNNSTALKMFFSVTYTRTLA
jgi:hypothetical protein